MNTVKIRKLRILNWCGVISYELYLIHGYVLSAVPVSMAGAIIFIVITILASIIF